VTSTSEEEVTTTIKNLVIYTHLSFTNRISLNKSSDIMQISVSTTVIVSISFSLSPMMVAGAKWRL